MIYFFHHYELPVIVQQARLQRMFMRPRRNNNNRQPGDGTGAAGGQQGGVGGSGNASATASSNEGVGGGVGSNQQMSRENQQQMPATAEAPPVNNINNMFLIRGAYRRRVNHIVERLRNNFYNNVLGVGLADNNNNNAANNFQNQQQGFNNLTRSLRLLNMLFPNRPILNVRIINVRSAATPAAAADIIRNNTENAGEFPSVVRLDAQQPNNGENNVPSTDAATDSLPPPNNPPVDGDANYVNAAEPESSFKCQTSSSTSAPETTMSDVDMNQSVNVMQSTTNGDGVDNKNEHLAESGGRGCEETSTGLSSSSLSNERRSSIEQ
jgi:hypothetical protein